MFGEDVESGVIGAWLKIEFAFVEDSFQKIVWVVEESVGDCVSVWEVEIVVDVSDPVDFFQGGGFSAF